MPIAVPGTGGNEAVSRPETIALAGGTRTARPSIIIDYKFDIDQDCIDELDEYIRLGALIRSQAGYNDSVIGRLENFLIRGRSAVEDYLGHDIFLIRRDSLQNAFYAIAAPSLEGKTQSAFVFGTVKPLYFVMNQNWTTNVQPIYKNFEYLSRQLAELSQRDVEHLIRLKNIPRGTRIDQYISAGSLLSDHNNEGFYVLGLFKALMIDAILNDDYNISWMEYYTTRNRELEIVPTSIAEFHELGLEARSQFCLFLDEFTGSDTSIFIRNLSRAANLKVLVANTNTNITNLVGRRQAKHSRINPVAWSLVFTKLNSLNWVLLTQMVPDLESLMSFLARKVHLNDRSHLDDFFTHFKTVQVKNVRPGFVHLIINAMRQFKLEIADNQFSFNEFLFNIVVILKTQLVQRKPNLESRYGRLATMALYLSNAYGPSLGCDQDLLYHRKSYVNDHFYYLINPVNINKFCFLTYPPSFVQRRRPANTQADSPPLQLYLGIAGMKDWKPERTIFEQGEVLPFLALMGSWHDESISFILEDANVYAEASPFTVGDTQNMTQAVPSNGNLLEVFTVVSLVNASHRDMNSSVITFTGQSGESFVTNLIKNLISDNDCRIRPDYEVLFPNDGVTGTIISRVHVPFLFPANLPIPTMFSPNLSNCEHFNSRSVHFGSIERTRNDEEIDCKFDFFLKNNVLALDEASARNINPSQGVCTVECKSWNTQNVNLSNLRSIFDKAHGNHADLCLLICNSVVKKFNQKSRSFVDFKAECIKRKWEVLKVVQRAPTIRARKIYSIERLHPEICLPDSRYDYNMTCIILELEVINS